MKQLCIGVVAAASLTLPAFGQASLKEQLIGTWTLVSCNGANAPYCAGNNGILLLDANGRYTVTIAARGRPKVDLATHGHDGLSAEEYKTSAIGLVTNFGTWSLNDTLTMHIDGALFTNLEGTDFEETISLSGDELKMVNPFDQTMWQRLKK